STNSGASSSGKFRKTKTCCFAFGNGSTRWVTRYLSRLRRTQDNTCGIRSKEKSRPEAVRLPTTPSCARFRVTTQHIAAATRSAIRKQVKSTQKSRIRGQSREPDARRGRGSGSWDQLPAH